MLNKFKKIDIINYEAEELKKLQIEIKILEEELESLIEEKNKYLIDIENFNKRYILELGDLIEKILQLKQSILYETFQVNQKYEYYIHYEEVKQDYQDFHQEYKKTIEKEKNINNLFEEETDIKYLKSKKTKIIRIY